MNEEKPQTINIRPEEVLEFLVELGAVSSGVVLSEADLEAISTRANILLSERPNMPVERAAAIAYFDRRTAISPDAGTILEQTDGALLQEVLETMTGGTITDEETAIFRQYLSRQTYGVNMSLTEIIQKWSDERALITKDSLPQVAIGDKGDNIIKVGPASRATVQEAQNLRAQE